MTSTPSDRNVQTAFVGILIVPGFTVLHLDLLVDGLRIANRVGQRNFFKRSICAPDAVPVEASNGRTFVPDDGLESGQMFNAIFVIAGYQPEQSCSEGISHWIRRHDRRGAVIGAVDTGAVMLARAGVGRERRMAIHWEHEAIFRENHPGIDVMTTGVIVDGRFFTSSGGLSVAELVLATISYFHGPVLAGQVGDVLYFSGNDTRRNTRNAPVSDPVRRAELLMIRNMQNPLALDEIAAKVHVHKRSLARRFDEKCGVSPMSGYRALRLDHAKELLLQDRLAIKELAVATGFSSATSFTTAFKCRFGASPRKLFKDHSKNPRSK